MQIEILKNTVRLRGTPAEIQAAADDVPAAAEITRSSKRRNKTFCGVLETACGGEDDLIAATADGARLTLSDDNTGLLRRHAATAARSGLPVSCELADLADAASGRSLCFYLFVEAV